MEDSEEHFKLAAQHQVFIIVNESYLQAAVDDIEAVMQTVEQYMKKSFKCT